MPIWKKTPTLSELQQMHTHTAEGYLGIEFTGVGDDWLSARMPVDRRTVQPFGILHGGASVLLAEAVGKLEITIYDSTVLETPGEALRTMSREIAKEDVSDGKDGRWVVEDLGGMKPIKGVIWVGVRKSGGEH